jgi:hypothetical protein
MDPEEIENLRVVYNREHSKESPIPSGDWKTVWSHLQKRFHQKCESGRMECIAAHMIKKPNAPPSWEKNPEEWLSSVDIEAIEKEYMRVFPKYHFVGCVPIDFDKQSKTGSCVVSALCSLNIKDLYDKGYDKIGIVFNTDVSTGPGQHWIALFADLDPDFEHARITYFDSYSHAPEPEIQRLMRRWKQQWDATGVHSKPTELTYNRTRHQYENSECGMYCVYFHLSCIVGLPMDKRISDDVMRSFRGMLFTIRKK